MTREELVDLAEEAGFDVIKEDNEFCNGRFSYTVWWDDRSLTPQLERFAELVAAKEREACAVILMDLHQQQRDKHNYFHFAANKIKEGITK